MKTLFNYKIIGDKFRGNTTVVFWILLLVLFLMEIFVLKTAWDTVKATREEYAINATRQVRINFAEFDNAIKRIENGQSYQPKPRLDASPFGTIQLTQ